MTATKLFYAIAAIIPGGMILLALFGILYVVKVGLRERRQRQAVGVPV